MSSLFDIHRDTLLMALARTTALLREYGPRYRRWCVAYSGGKDSSAVLTVVAYLIAAGEIERPELLAVRYADTRMELPPLQSAAMAMLDRFRVEGWNSQAVLPAMDDRFFVYMFGRGVPPPSNTFRWCTAQLKIEPMAAALDDLGDGRTLMLTGVRIGESAARDDSIAAACSRDGAECGQGWMHGVDGQNDINRYFVTGPGSIDTLAPILHWRVCHVWDWLCNTHNECPDHGYQTEAIAEVYGGEGDHERLVELSARTGCVACNLASRDVALDRLIRRPRWKYLAPLKRLRELYAWLKRPENRLRKDGSETKADGSLVSNPNRLGPLTMPARRRGTSEVLAIQQEICDAARKQGEPDYVLIDDDELLRINELIAAGTWPNRWSGDEITGDVMIPETRPDGSIQQLLPMAWS